MPKSKWNVMGVVTADDNDGRLYPLLGSESCLFETEQRDGEIVEISCMGLSIQEDVEGSLRELGTIKDENVRLYITSGRVVVVCENWNKGGRAWGVGLGATAALAINVTRSMREARARRGTMLMGHIRLGWVDWVGFWSPKRRTQYLRIACEDGNDESARGRKLILTTHVRSDASENISNIIARQVANFWLGNPSLPEGHRDFMEALASRANGSQKAIAKQYTITKIPIHYSVNVKTAEIA